MAAETGTKLGRYEIRSKLGEGGMGEVYRALDSELDRPVAIKILPEVLASDQQRLQRFIQEARAASALNHPHILTIHEIGTFGNTRFIAMEFIDGETLRQHMQSPRKLTDILEIAIQTAGALSAAHEAGIVHRDIKPENIMVRRDGYVKVLDFGLAKLTETASGASDPEAATRAIVNTGAGTVMGTANYMSPEQAKGTHVDARSDIWSLGAVLYEMIAGRVPFPGETPTETISFILLKEPAPLARLQSNVPDELDRIVTKALTKNRDERYQTTKDLLIDLRNLKRKLEVNAEIDRTVAPELRPALSTSSGVSASSTVSGVSAPATAGATAHSASSAEYIVSGIKQHKLAVALAIFALAIGGVVLAWYLHARNTEVAIDSIAVLPFQNQSGDPADDWLADGVTESIINSLTQLPNLKVIARSSVFRYKGKDTDPFVVGKDLGVRAVLVGRMIQRGDTVTVSTELVDVRDNKQLWGEQYDEKVADLMALPRDIASKITSNLRLTISGEDRNRMMKHDTNNAEAYQLYLKGLFYWNKRTAEALRTSIDFYNQAIAKDPGYAQAYAGMAEAYVLLPEYSAATPDQSIPKAKAAAKKALELDETIAEAHTALARALYTYDRNMVESVREYQRAIALNPNYATAHQWYADNLIVMQRSDDSLAEGRRAVELDPLSLVANLELATNYNYARRYDQAITQLRKIFEIDRNWYLAHMLLCESYDLKGQFAEAIVEGQKARELNDDPFVLAVLGHAYAGAGKRDEAMKLLGQMNEVAKQRYVPAYGFAILYAGVGDKNQAFEWLERSLQDRAWDITYLKVDPFMESLHPDPRFADLVKRVGL